MTAPHAGFILAAYGVTFVTVGVMTASVILRHRALRRALASLGAEDETNRERA